MSCENSATVLSVNRIPDLGNILRDNQGEEVILGQRKIACNLYDVGEMNACLLEPFMICLATPALINARATIRHYALNTNGNQRRSLMILCQRDKCSNYITSMGYSGTTSPIARLATFCHETIFGWCFP
eukprot:scaffold382_cov415-Chaetoceros_neogracile.AAC.4